MVKSLSRFSEPQHRQWPVILKFSIELRVCPGGGELIPADQPPPGSFDTADTLFGSASEPAPLRFLNFGRAIARNWQSKRPAHSCLAGRGSGYREMLLAVGLSYCPRASHHHRLKLNHLFSDALATLVSCWTWFGSHSQRDSPPLLLLLPQFDPCYISGITVRMHHNVLPARSE